MFGWFKKKDTKPIETPNMFMGVDLNDWAYLGYVELSFVDKDKKPILKERVFFFCEYANDEDDEIDLTSRKFTFGSIDPGEFKHHQYYDHLHLWRIGEYDIHQMIGTRPSSRLKEYMLDKYGVVWDNEKSSWIANQASVDKKKYQDALDKQKNPTIITSDQNVVKVEFKK